MLAPPHLKTRSTLQYCLCCWNCVCCTPFWVVGTALSLSVCESQMICITACGRVFDSWLHGPTDSGQGNIDLDASALAFDFYGNWIEQETVFFGRTQNSNSSVQHTGECDVDISLWVLLFLGTVFRALIILVVPCVGTVLR